MSKTYTFSTFKSLFDQVDDPELIMDAMAEITKGMILAKHAEAFAKDIQKQMEEDGMPEVPSFEFPEEFDWVDDGVSSGVEDGAERLTEPSEGQKTQSSDVVIPFPTPDSDTRH